MKKMTQTEAVIETIRQLGGVASIMQINQNIFKMTDAVWNTKTPYASIRCILQRTPNQIYKIRPGLYGLLSHKQLLENNGIIVQTEKNKDSEIVNTFNHTYYQGLLLEIGKMRLLDTFVPAQDKNKKFLEGDFLGHMSTLDVIPSFTYEDIVQRSSTIDVIWFNERHLPDSFFEVEHSTDIQNSLLKYYDLRDFSARMVIVADAKRLPEYNKKLGYDAFTAIKNKVKFLSYDSLDKQYAQELQKAQLDFVL